MLTDKEREDLRQHLQERLHLKIREKRIKAIRVNSGNHWQKPMRIEVGGWCANLEKDTPPEEILAIFEHASFVVITPDRGMKEGTLPYFFGRQDVRQVILFE